MVVAGIPRLHTALAIGYEHADRDAVEIVREHAVVIRRDRISCTARNTRGYSISPDASSGLWRFASGHHQPKKIDGLHPVRVVHFNGTVDTGIMERNSGAMDDIHGDRGDRDCEHAR